MSLRGMAWDHPRAYQPLEAFAKECPSPAVSWDRQSLADFEARPVTELAKEYDVMIVDHPGLGAAIAAGAIQPLRRLVPREVMAEWKATSFVPTWDSYVVGGQPWALPVDAATQVSVCRPDLIIAAPRAWAEVPALARERRVALCLGGPHAFLTVLAMCAPGESLLPPEVAVSALADPDPGEVAAFLTAFWTAEVQAGLVPDHAGQSAHVAAWDSPRVDRDWGGYYSSTRRSLAAAWIRPRDDGWIGLQERAGVLVREAVTGAADAAAVVAAINSEYRSLKGGSL
jgi:hypothetical protein